MTVNTDATNQTNPLETSVGVSAYNAAKFVIGKSAGFVSDYLGPLVNWTGRSISYIADPKNTTPSSLVFGAICGVLIWKGLSCAAAPWSTNWCQIKARFVPKTKIDTNLISFADLVKPSVDKLTKEADRLKAETGEKVTAAGNAVTAAGNAASAAQAIANNAMNKAQMARTTANQASFKAIAPPQPVQRGRTSSFSSTEAAPLVPIVSPQPVQRGRASSFAPLVAKPAVKPTETMN